jgi:PTS system nitrogen regulatory IIA component
MASPEPIHIRDLLSRERVRTDLSASSKKSLLDQLAAEFQADHPELDEREVFQTLLRREQLGSTAVGHGVALPHGRLGGLARPLGAFTRLAAPADFDAIDDQPVTLVFALLVPDEENEQHLQVLARLARMFDDSGFREQLLQAPAAELFDLLVRKDEEMAGS